MFDLLKNQSSKIVSKKSKISNTKNLILLNNFLIKFHYLEMLDKLSF